MEGDQTLKRPYEADEVPNPKRARAAEGLGTESPRQYSDAVRKKLSSTTRTGQACDRCKERKMKCDTNPVACGPCQSKRLQCLTTDRVTGRASERGQPERLEGELHSLRREVAAYQRRFGAFRDEDFYDTNGYSAIASIASINNAPMQLRQQHIPPDEYSTNPSITDVHFGPVSGTLVDTFDDTVIDIANFSCPDVEEYNQDDLPKFNHSRTSFINTICGAQRIDEPRLPPKEEALKEINNFLTYIWPYVPVVHCPTFLEMATRYYDEPAVRLSKAEVVEIVLVLAITAHQSAVRNPQVAKEKMDDAHRWLHYALGFYRDLFHDTSLASVTAMTLLCIHARNLPKPGFAWVLSHEVLVRSIELDYHRSPDRIALPEAENNPIAKELRKRVFWSILGICVTTGTKIGKPAPWHFQHSDCPLPLAIEDNELTMEGVAPNRSGKCEFRVALHLFKLLPLLTDLYNNVISVRKPSGDYLAQVKSLNAQILAWRQAWNHDGPANKVDGKHDGKDEVAELHIETWAAEYQLILHHPKLCPVPMPDVYDRHLDTCYRAARKLLQAFHTLANKFKGADFTWHSTVAYALGFGATLQWHRRRKEPVTQDKHQIVQNELSGWLGCMRMADRVLHTGSHLYRTFAPRVRALQEEYETLLKSQRQHSLNNSTSQPPQDPQQPSPTNSYTPTLKYDTAAASTNLPPPYAQSAQHALVTQSQGQYSYPPVPVAQLPHSGATPTSSSYPAYTTQGQYASVPTSLAPLLNAETSNPISYIPYSNAAGNPDPYAESPGQSATTLMKLATSHSTESWFSEPDAVAAAALWPMSISKYHQPQQQHEQGS